jgi:hypothetical protein
MGSAACKLKEAPAKGVAEKPTAQNYPVSIY